jgi:putative endonuclease
MANKPTNQPSADASAKMLAPHLLKGQQAEAAAYDYLSSQGLSLLARNYHARCGEIDLIMLDGNVLVFIEVRYRKTAQYGGAAGSINYKKQQRIRNTAAVYLQKNGNNYPARFDVCAIYGNMQINWIKQAF